METVLLIANNPQGTEFKGDETLTHWTTVSDIENRFDPIPGLYTIPKTGLYFITLILRYQVTFLEYSPLPIEKPVTCYSFKSNGVQIEDPTCLPMHNVYTGQPYGVPYRDEVIRSGKVAIKTKVFLNRSDSISVFKKGYPFRVPSSSGDLLYTGTSWFISSIS